jgi:coenzyme PQQ precursor peptide PqqA
MLAQSGWIAVKLSAQRTKGGANLPPIITKERTMAWTTPTLVEICIGLEINGYLPAEF